MAPLHSRACLDQQLRDRTVLIVWAGTWPNWCRSCRGFGAFYDYGSYEVPPSCEPCDDCTGRGICSRCAHAGLTSEDRGDQSTGDGPCRCCGWNYDDGLPDFSSGWGICECDEARIKAEMTTGYVDA